VKITEAQLRAIIREEKAKMALDSSRRQLSEFDLGDLGQVIKAPANFAVGQMKEWVAERIIGFLGLNPDKLFSKAIVNAVGNLTADEIYQIVFGNDRCFVISNEILQALMETLLEELPSVFGYEPTSSFGKLFEEAVTDLLAQNSGLAEYMSREFCDLLGMESGETTKELQDIKRILDFS
jgi:hypothetical protein